ncbi:MAG: protein kinase domain-containing protein [Vicinamibacterales bacterium]
MNPERDHRVEEIFERVVEAPPTERRRRLVELCAGDDTLASAVWPLVEADAADHPLLSLGGAELAAALLDSGRGAAFPRRFGRYVIREHVAEGGVGSVYLADRDDLGDRVAVKFLHDSWTSPARRERFASEQRTLAGLNHGHIARLYDAGVTDGTPWFAMEYVEGPAITGYCARKGLDLRGRLQLFRTVCEAVSYAHRNLIVHLDLKPANILVNGDGEVKLVDFGIARHLTEAGGSAEKTATGQRLLSINYAAPEQIRGEALGVQTDVFALGVVLYELLAGRPPADLSSANASELTRWLHEEPARPSIAAHAPDRPAVHASGAEWRELDVICLTALRRERAARYATVDHLLRDVDHFLADEPLEARTGTLRYYTMRKFVSRRRHALATAAAALIVLASTSVFFTVRLVDARDRAVASEVRMERVHRLMLNLFEGDDSAAGPAGELRVASLLDRGVREANALDTEPDMQAELRRTLGGLYHKLGHLDPAEPLLRSSLAGLQAALGQDHPQTVKARLALALLRIDQAEPDEARRLVDGAVRASRRRPRVDRIELATANAVLGKALLTEGDYAAAVPLLEGSVNVLSAGPPSVELSEALGDLANAQYYLGQIDASQRTNLRSLTLDRQMFGDRHPHVAVDLYNLGNIRLDWGDYGGGEELFRQALQINEAWYGPDHPKTASTVLMTGRSLAYLGRLDEAATLYDRAADVMRATYGEQHPRFASVLSLRGDLAREEGDLDGAERLFRRAAQTFKDTAGERHEFYLHQLSNLGSVALARREWIRAEQLLASAVKVLREVVPDQRYTAIAQIRLGAALAGANRHAEAEHPLVEGYQSLRRLTRHESAEIRSARETLLAVYDALKMPDKAAALRRVP